MGEAGYQSAPHGVDDSGHHDWNRAGGLLDGPDLDSAGGNDEIRLEARELGRERRGGIILVLGPPAFDR